MYNYWNTPTLPVKVMKAPVIFVILTLKVTNSLYRNVVNHHGAGGGGRATGWAGGGGGGLGSENFTPAIFYLLLCPRHCTTDE